MHLLHNFLTEQSGNLNFLNLWHLSDDFGRWVKVNFSVAIAYINWRLAHLTRAPLVTSW